MKLLLLSCIFLCLQPAVGCASMYFGLEPSVGRFVAARPIRSEQLYSEHDTAHRARSQTHPRKLLQVPCQEIDKYTVNMNHSSISHFPFRFISSLRLQQLDVISCQDPKVSNSAPRSSSGIGEPGGQYFPAGHKPVPAEEAARASQ